MECTDLNIEQLRLKNPMNHALMEELLMKAQTYYQPNMEADYIREPTSEYQPESSDLDVEYDGYTWEWKLRTCPKEIIEMEEQERQWRMSRGINPMMYARLFRVQTEMMHRHIPTTYWNDAKASFSSTFFTAKEATKGKASIISEKWNGLQERAHDVAVNLQHSAADIIHQLDLKSQEFAVNTNHKVDEMKTSLSKSVQNLDEKQEEFSVATNEKASEVKEVLSESVSEIKSDASELYSETKGKMGEIRTTMAEERERSRRMNTKQDPSLIEKRNIVTEDLLNNTKTVN